MTVMEMGYGDAINGNNPDRFPDDSTQWVDQDNDGYGDNPNGTNPDSVSYTHLTLPTKA